MKAECDLREKAMKHMRAVESKLKISCTRPVKERQKFVRELFIGRNKTMRMASKRESRDSD